MKKAYIKMDENNSDSRRIHIRVEARKKADGVLKLASHYTPDEMRKMENSICNEDHD